MLALAKSPLFLRPATLQSLASVAFTPLTQALRTRFYHMALNPGIFPPAIKIRPIPMLDDNYGWLLSNEITGVHIIVDPSESEPCLAALKEVGALELHAILLTHFHKDHSGGLPGLLEAYPSAKLYASSIDGERVQPKGVATHLADGESVELPGGIKVKAIFTPFHTRGHTCFQVTGDPEKPHGAVFTGDCLFVGGCGRFFEGNAEQAAESLGKLMALAPETEVYCGHEYTVSNLTFGAHAEPSNAAIAEKLQKAKKLREEGKPTVPSTIGEELATNVFLRFREASLAEFCKGVAMPAPAEGHAAGAAGAEGGALTPVDVLARIRHAKNEFR